MQRQSPAPAPKQCYRQSCARPPLPIAYCRDSLALRVGMPASCPGCLSIRAGRGRGWRARGCAGRPPSAECDEKDFSSSVETGRENFDYKTLISVETAELLDKRFHASTRTIYATTRGRSVKTVSHIIKWFSPFGAGGNKLSIKSTSNSRFMVGIDKDFLRRVVVEWTCRLMLETRRKFFWQWKLEMLRTRC